MLIKIKKYIQNLNITFNKYNYSTKEKTGSTVTKKSTTNNDTYISIVHLINIKYHG